jgi:hypothetical protein
MKNVLSGRLHRLSCSPYSRRCRRSNKPTRLISSRAIKSEPFLFASCSVDSFYYATYNVEGRSTRPEVEVTGNSSNDAAIKQQNRNLLIIIIIIMVIAYEQESSFSLSASTSTMFVFDWDYTFSNWRHQHDHCNAHCLEKQQQQQQQYRSALDTNRNGKLETRIYIKRWSYFF